MHRSEEGAAPRIRELERLKRIGSGGFGTVYRGWDPTFQNYVAVKVLHVRGRTPRALARFQDECRALGQLRSHRNVVTVYRAGTLRYRHPYIVMEYLGAGSLAERDLPVGWEEAVSVGVKLAGALQSAHDAGILHLDIKPQNILVGDGGEPMLADFGIAQLGAMGAGSEASPIGTIPYAAPEVMLGAPPTKSADVYSLGATLFELLSGRPAFVESDDVSLAVLQGRALYGRLPDLRRRRIPDEVCAVIERAMAKTPHERFGSARELGEALQDVQQARGLAVTDLQVIQVPMPTPGPRRSRPSRGWVVGTATALVLLLAAGAWALWRPSPLVCGASPRDGLLRIGTLLTETGRLAAQGQRIRAGVELAVQDVIAAGGVPGVQLAPLLDNEDSGDPSTDTPSRAAGELLDRKPDVIIGVTQSAGTLQAIDQVTRAGVVLFSPSNTAAALTTASDCGKYFRAAPSDVRQAATLGELVFDDGNQTATVIARDDAYGESLSEGFKDLFEALGGTVLHDHRYDPRPGSDYGDIRRIVADDPDAVVLIGYEETADILRLMIQEGAGPGSAHVYGVDGNLTNDLARLVDPANPGVLDGMRGTTLPRGSEEFAQRLRTVDATLTDRTYAVQAYDTVIVTALAAAVAGTDDPAEIAEQINEVTTGGARCTSYTACLALIAADRNADIDYDGLSGPLEFDERGEPGSGTYEIVEIGPNGLLTTV